MGISYEIDCNPPVPPGGGGIPEGWPIGVPVPGWNYDIETPAPPSPWTTEVAGYYYVNYETGTDSGRPYGYPAAPRQTVPTSLAAGAYVEIHGTYSRSHTSPDGITASGTSGSPIFIVGVEGSEPTLTKGWELNACTYTVLEHLKWAIPSPAQSTALVIHQSSAHLVLRDSEITGSPEGGGGIGLGNASDVFIQDNVIHDNGDWQTLEDQDRHGITVNETVTNLWILNNEFYHNSGDGVQINASSPAGIQYVYVGKNLSYTNKQNGLWTKTASDIIFSQNLCHSATVSPSGGGVGLGYQYDPVRVWFLFNECYGNELGGLSSGSSDVGGREDIYFIGNYFHDNSAFGMELNDSVDGDFLAINNTFYNNPIGISNGYYQISLVMSNNIFAHCSTAGISFNAGNGSGGTSTVRNSLFHPSFHVVWDETDYTNLTTFQSDESDGVACAVGDPLFVDENNGNFNLQVGSAAIGMGAAETAYATYLSLYGVSIALDADGRTRPQGGTWDAGAYEYGS